MTEVEYLARERAVEARHEYRDGRMVPMPPSPYRHSAFIDRLSAKLNTALDGTRFHALSKSMRVRSPAGAYLYPDLLVCRDTPALDDVRDTLFDPVAVIEVPTAATVADDYGAKRRLYQAIPSLTDYLLVAYDRVRVERFTRQPNGLWVLTEFADPAGVLALESVPVSVPLADVYAGVPLGEVPLR